MNTRYTYEIEYDVIHPRAYHRWLSTAGLQWINHDTVAAFAVRYTDERVKLLFGFSSLESWKTFLESAEHEATLEALADVVTSLDGTLWERGGIRLEDVDAPLCSTPPSDVHGATTEGHQ